LSLPPAGQEERQDSSEHQRSHLHARRRQRNHKGHDNRSREDGAQAGEGFGLPLPRLQARCADELGPANIHVDIAMKGAGRKSVAMHQRYVNLKEGDVAKAFGLLENGNTDGRHEETRDDKERVNS
jgi:hypothetical protein